MTLARLGTFFYGAALVTLPWVGAGVLKLATGRDWGGGLQPSWLFLALAVLCVLADRMRRGSRGPAPWKDLEPGLRRWWLLGIGAVAGSVLLSLAGLWVAPAAEPIDVTLQRFLKQVVQLAVMGVFALGPALWTRGRRKWQWTIRLLLFGGLFQVFYGVVQGLDYYHQLAGFSWLDRVFTSNPSILSGSGELYLGDSFRHIPRLRGTVCEPLYLGNVLLFLWPLTLVPFGSSRFRRLLGAAFLVLLLGTWSRGAWLGFLGQALLLVVAAACARKRGRRGLFAGISLGRKGLFAGAAVLFAGILLVALATGWQTVLFPFHRLYQTFSNQDWSNLTRLYSMQAAWRAFLLSPLVGIGWGQFGWHFPMLVDPMGLQSQFTWPVVNNYPLLVLCETGLVGLLVFAGWIAGMARGLRRRWLAVVPSGGSSPDEEVYRANLVLAVSVSGAGVLFQLLTFSQYNLPHIWVCLGLVMAVLADTGPSGEEGSSAGRQGKES